MSIVLSNFEKLVQNPSDVEWLKQLVLDLAVRGKLVPQNIEDESVDVLLKNISQKKNDIIKEKKVKKSKPILPLTETEIPFQIPSSWDWIKLETLCTYIQRGKSPKYVDQSSIPVISQKCVQWRGFEMFKAKFLNPLVLEKYAEERFLKTGDLLWNSTGLGTLGRIIIYDEKFNSFEKAVADSHVTVIRPVSDFKKPLSSFLFLWFASPFVQNEINDKSTGSTKQTELGTTTVKNYAVPLPPLAEQLRIVQKVNSLFQKIDALADQTQRAQITRQKLRTAFLHRLDQAESATQLSQAWQSLIPQFDRVFDSVEAIKALRKSILQLAVKGKLVEQNGEEESANVLLEKIKKEKERLVEEKKIKKQKVLPKIEEKDIPYDLPKGWEWCRMGNIFLYLLGGCAFKSSEYVESSSNQIIRLGNVKNDFLKLSANPVFISQNIANESEKYKLKVGDILITMTGTRAKKDYCFTTLINERNLENKNLFLNQRVGCFRFGNFIFDKYLNIGLKADSILNPIFESATGTANQANISSRTLTNMVFPLPPLAEQKRIVEKVGQLMSWCDDLESLLEKRGQQQKHLLGRVLKGVFEEEKIGV